MKERRSDGKATEQGGSDINIYIYFVLLTCARAEVFDGHIGTRGGDAEGENVCHRRDRERHGGRPQGARHPVLRRVPEVRLTPFRHQLKHIVHADTWKKTSMPVCWNLIYS